MVQEEGGQIHQLKFDGHWGGQIHQFKCDGHLRLIIKRRVNLATVNK